MTDFFPSFFGNDALRSRLGQLVSSKQFPHALMIEGKKGSGKKTLATLLAAALSCDEKAATLPCMQCNACRKILANQSVDVNVIDRGDRATIGIDKIREMREDVHLSATEFQNKIYIIEDANLLTKEAQNALLLSIEEPPPHVFFFLLCTQTESILPTIKSRVQTVRLQTFDADTLSHYLTEKNQTAKVLADTEPLLFQAVVMTADGTVGQALTLLNHKEREKLFKEREKTDAILLALIDKKPYSVLYDKMAALPTKRQELSTALAWLARALRDLLLLKRDAHAKCLYHVDAEEAREKAERLGIRYLLSLFDRITAAEEECAFNANIPSLIANLTNELYSCRSL